MKKDLIRSMIVLLTIVNGIIAAFSLGMTELIKYLFQDAATSKGMQAQLDKFMLRDVSFQAVALKDNMGWGFLALMLLGIIVIVAINNTTRFHMDDK